MTLAKFRNSAIAGLAAIAFVAAGSLAAPDEANANGKVAAALIGGALLGGLIASQTPVYAAPVYPAPVVYQTCYWQKQQVWYPNPGYYAWQNVKVCY
ncbi:MAG: hypothetical protein BroJett030_02060 [Alphaproteobacteria bacterium]|nr:MAG: hypothetical protein BroJett030_02060 [Alphaproteobacteria bacterium]